MRRSGEQVAIEGVVERIIFFNEENCYCIASVKQYEKNAKGTITISGIMPALQCGETIKVKGEWTSHHSYGVRINVKEFESRLPSSVYGIEKFLGSGLVDGIGPVYARKIVSKFGENTLHIIDSDSKRLTEVKGIGAERARRIKKSWDEQRGLRDLIISLRIYGIGMALCARIMKRFGAESAEIVRTKPYLLSREIDGIGFKTADMIALNIGISNESSERLEAGVLYALSEIEDEGGTCVPCAEIVARASSLLQVDKAKCAEAIERLTVSGDLRILGDGLLQSASLDYAERRIASNIRRICKAPSILPPIKHEIAVEWVKDKAKIQFAPAQTEAILAAIKNKFSIITGGPGTGKTTILRAVCEILKAKKITPVLAAPTGRAAQRMGESTNIQAGTIHRILGFENGKFKHGEYNPISARFVIIDEASMLDTKLAAAIFSAIPDGAHLVLVGDIDQLPSVGAGNVLKDIIACGKFPVTRLDKIFRQGDRSGIVLAARDILEGNDSTSAFPPTNIGGIDFFSDVNFIYADTPEACIKNCVELIANRIPREMGVNRVSDIQLLAPMHKGAAGIENFNLAVKNAINPRDDGLRCAGGLFCVGDKIMQTRNNYDIDVFNGDMGIITSVAKDNSGVYADFDGKKIFLAKADLSDFKQAYAISIHKSQGSEFPVVVMPLLRQHFIMLQRNLLYTGITRARKKVFIVGDPSAWSAAVRNARATERKTYLAQRFEKLWG